VFGQYRTEAVLAIDANPTHGAPSETKQAAHYRQ
jgi:hypothetical protein